MGQSEILEWMRYQRIELKNDGYFTRKEIAKALRMSEGVSSSLESIRGDLAILLRWDFIEYKLGGNVTEWCKHYRYRIPPKRIT